MGVHVIKVPDVGEGIAEVELVSWSVSIGDPVTRNQILAEVMTDKANVEIPSPTDGVIASLNGEVGGVMAVGSPLIELTIDGPSSAPAIDDVHLSLSVTANVAEPPPPTGVGHSVEHGATTEHSATIEHGAALGDSVTAAVAEIVVDSSQSEPPAPAVAAAPVVTEAPAVADAEVRRPVLRREGEAPLATPAVRHRAREAGIDLRQVSASGPAGRITHADLDSFRESYTTGTSSSPAVAPPSQAQPDLRVEEQPIIGMRRQIAKRMVASTQSIPHITYVEEIDMTALEELRGTLNAESSTSSARLTVLPFLVKAMVDAISRYPQMNAHVDDESETLTIHGGVHVGIATQTPNGLVVPVIRHAETASIWSLATQIASLAELARTGKAAPADLSGSTITISSLGSLGGLVTTPVINKPEVAIVGVNKMVTRPVFVDDVVVARKMMNLSSSFDHRIVDGWDAASFIQRIRTLLEQPALLFVDQPPEPGGDEAVDRS